MSPLLLAPTRSRISTPRLVLVLIALVTAVRLAFVPGSLHPDEAGYLVVARSWHLGGPNLYGHYFVDRPPFLILLFRLASLVHADPFIRVLTIPFCALFVASAAWAAHQLAGRAGGRWAAVAATALILTPLVEAQEANGELFAASLVMFGVALVVAAVRRTGAAAFGFAVLAGVVAGLALMTKQNFGDVIVFAVVLVGASVIERRLGWRDGLLVLLGGVAGGSVVLAALLAYLHAAHVSLGRAWFSIYGFRGTALDVLAETRARAPFDRGIELAGLAVLTGIVPVLLVLARHAWRRRWAASPTTWAVVATLVVEAVAIGAGGSYWPHYLLQLAPMVVLAVGLWAPALPSVRVATGVLVLSAVIALPVGWVLHTMEQPSAGQITGNAVRAAGRPGDTATVLYGNAQVQEATGMWSPYPQLWSLPTRTLDPRLRHLRHLLAGPHAPDWVVVWSRVDLWHIDPHQHTRHVLASHYRHVGRVCGHQIWLHDGLQRPLPGSYC